MVLLGDAAHPTYIYISQGACMALEDAVLLADQVSKIDDVRAAFRAYEDIRYLRAARIQLTSRQFGEVYHATGALRDLRNTLLATARPEALYDTLGWVFGAAGADVSLYKRPPADQLRQRIGEVQTTRPAKEACAVPFSKSLRSSPPNWGSKNRPTTVYPS